MTILLKSRLLAILAVLGGLSVGLAGCRSTEEPGGYSNDRPPADRLDSRDRGIQSYDVVVAADRMAESLLTLPEIQTTPERLIVVVDRVVNMTSFHDANLDIFLALLRNEISQRGREQIQLISDRDTLRDIQSRELELPPGDDFGGAPGPAGIQPHYALHAEVSDLPNRGTNFFLFSFTLTDLRTREDVWTDAYTVRTGS